MRRRYMCFAGFILLWLAAGCADSTPGTGPVGPTDLSVSAALAPDQRQFAFASFEPEGASFTEVRGINSSGAIVGVYTVPGLPQAGFLLEKDVFTRIEFPQASGGPAVTVTGAYGINAAGDIVGVYRLAGEGPTEMHGFLRTKAGSFFTVDVPGRMGTVATAILADGTILGCSHDTNMTTTMYGFVRDRLGNITDDANAGTMPFAATPGVTAIVGRYADTSTGTVQHYGYVRDAMGLQLFREPGTTFTQAWGVNPRKEIVGYSWRSGVGYRGFIRYGDAYTTLHFPDATAAHTFALGINAGGDVVGSYHDGVKYRGFVASRTQQHNK
jgi:hypothetical protein